MAERDLIDAIVARIGRPPAGGRVLRGPGDDAAVVRSAGVQVVSTDTTVDGVHVRLAAGDAAAWRDAGHRALSTALSDLAAMDVPAGEAYVALTLPPAAGRDDALALADGMAACARRWGVAIAGGDVTAGPGVVVTVTVVGHVEDPDAPLGRDGARPGDRVGVTGPLGGAAAGLLLAEHAAVAPADLDPDVRAALLARHRRPPARLDLVGGLRSTGVTAGIDLSDGVATDATHVGRAGGVSLRIDLAALPRQAGVVAVARAHDRDPAELAATGGEDHELLVCVAPGSPGPTGVVWVGEVVDGAPGATLHVGGVPRALGGYEHPTA